MKQFKVDEKTPCNGFFAYVEAGFDGGWRYYYSLNEALKEVCYCELYVAYKVDENTVKQLLEESRNGN